MPTDVNRVRACLKNSDFKNLFIEELGWNRYPGRPLSLTLADVTYTLEPLAEKKGFAVFVCAPGPDGGIPTYAERSKIDRQVEKLAHEHLIVYRDRAETVQRWQWVRRETGRPTRCREYEFVPGRKENDVAQRLANIAVELDEEEKATIVSISSKVTKSFDVDRVTKRFYDRFKAEREAFLGFIEGIKKADDRAWY